LKKLPKDRPALKAWLKALQEGRPGPGWAERFPYFHLSELLPTGRLEEFLDLLGSEEAMPPDRFRRDVARFVQRFPQIVIFAEKAIWEEMQPNVGIAILEAIDTPAAHAALRCFGLSQAGEDEDRMRALQALYTAGQIAPDETLHIWHDGEWREVQMRQYEISDADTLPYDDEVVDLLNEGLAALKADRYDEAERLLQRALELEPRAKEAYNNLASIYARRKDREHAAEMYRAALEIDPLYVFPRCNLASFLLNDDDVEGAIEMLKPLADLQRFHPQEMAFYSFTQARIHIKKEEYEEARKALELALEIWPEYELAQNLLERLNLIALTGKAMKGFWERQHDRDKAWRARFQDKLSTPEPTLAEALPLYSKEVLTGMAHHVARWGGWTTLRKTELIEYLIDQLDDADNLDWLVGRLADEEQDALRQVLARGGAMPWQEFDAAYGNDLEESRYWQWHEPETIMGRLRMHGLLVEATVDGELLIAIPAELRPHLAQILG
jgi:tetratricopeptide (TPR) repeat protein